MEKEYHQPREIKLAAWLFLMLATPVFVMLFWEYLHGRIKDQSAIMLIPLLFMPFYIGAIWLLWHFRGKFILKPDGILLQQFGKDTFLRFLDIQRIEERDSQLLPYLLLTTPTQRLKISFKVDNFSVIYAILRERIPVMKVAESEKLPLKLRFRPGYLREMLPVAGAYLFFTGILSMGATREQSWELGTALLMWGIFILLPIFLFWLEERLNPYAVDIDQDQIEARYLFGRARKFKSGEIASIARERQIRQMRYNTKLVVHPIVVSFENGERLQIEEGRIWAFGYSPDRLLVILKRAFWK